MDAICFRVFLNISVFVDFLSIIVNFQKESNKFINTAGLNRRHIIKFGILRCNFGIFSEIFANFRLDFHGILHKTTEIWRDLEFLAGILRYFLDF